MAKPAKSAKSERHLYFDQQKPLEEPVDAEHSTVVQYQFSRHPPTTEDEYFLERELRRRRHGEFPRREGGLASPRVRPRLYPADELAATDRPDSFWNRVARAVNRWTNTRWRP